MGQPSRLLEIQGAPPSILLEIKGALPCILLEIKGPPPSRLLENKGTLYFSPTPLSYTFYARHRTIKVM